MIMLLGSLDVRTNSSPLRSTSKLSVRKMSAGFESFSRNHAEHAFSVSRISRTFSRARRIFCPAFPILETENACSAWFRERSEEHTSELQSHLNLVCRL